MALHNYIYLKHSVDHEAEVIARPQDPRPCPVQAEELARRHHHHHHHHHSHHHTQSKDTTSTSRTKSHLLSQQHQQQQQYQQHQPLEGMTTGHHTSVSVRSVPMDKNASNGSSYSSTSSCLTKSSSEEKPLPQLVDAQGRPYAESAAESEPSPETGPDMGLQRYLSPKGEHWVVRNGKKRRLRPRVARVKQ